MHYVINTRLKSNLNTWDKLLEAWAPWPVRNFCKIWQCLGTRSWQVFTGVLTIVLTQHKLFRVYVVKSCFMSLSSLPCDVINWKPIIYLLLIELEVCTVKYESSFSCLIYGPTAKCCWAKNWQRKTSIHILQIRGRKPG